MSDLPGWLQATRQQTRQRRRPLPRSMRPAWETTPEATQPYRAPQQALSDPRTVPYEASPTQQQIQQDRELERFARMHELNRNDVNTPPGTYFGQDTLEMTGAPALSRGMDAIAAGDPGRALPEVAMGGASILGWGFGATPAGRAPRLPRTNAPMDMADLGRLASQGFDAPQVRSGPDAGPPQTGRTLFPELGANDRGALNRIGALGDEFTDSAAGQGFRQTPTTVREAVESAGEVSPTRGAFLADSWARSMHQHIERGNLAGFSNIVRIAGEESPAALVATARSFARQSRDPAILARAGDFNSVNDLAAAEDFLTHVWRQHDPQFQNNLRIRRASEARALRSEQNAARTAPDGGPAQAGRLPPDEMRHTRYWVERYGGGAEGEAKALRDYRDDLAEAQRWPENVRQRRIDELEEQIRWIESGEYRRAPPNNFSARVEEAFPDLYASRTGPNAGPPRPPPRPRPPRRPTE